MPIIDLQKRARELGRIRMGQVVKAKSGKTRPDKLDRFRLTSASQPLLERVAGLYGGTVTEWTPANGGPQQWEVITESTRLPVLVPPQPVTQWYELWSGGGCQRRCDGATEILSDSPCICAAQDDRVCKPTTRLNVVLRDVEGIGVWRLESHGFYAASELPQVAEFLAQAGGYVSAWLALEERIVKREVDGKSETRRFMVPTLDVGVTPAQLMASGGGAAINGTPVVTPAVEGSARPALESPSSRDWLAEATSAATLDEWRELWRLAASSPEWSPQLEAGMRDAGNRLANSAGGGETAGAGNGKTQQATAGGSPAPAETEADPDAVWMQILTAAGSMDPPMTTDQVEADFASKNAGVMPNTASGGELAAYLNTLKEK